MTRITIDDQGFEFTANETKPLGDFLESLLRSLPSDRVVTEIFLNGKRLSGFETQDLMSLSLSRVEDLRLRTASKRMWANDGLENALSSVNRLQQSLLRATERFHEEDIGSAREWFAHCMDGLEKFLETMSLTKNVLEIDFDDVDVHGIKLSEIASESTRLLLRLRSQCLEDPKSAAERVEYELLPNLSCWNQALQKLHHPES